MTTTTAADSRSSQTPDAIIEVRDVTVAYGPKVVMRDINFDVNRGEVFIILGGSGCGKSSLLKNLIGLFKPTKGSVRINGRSIMEAQGRERDAILRDFGVMYQSGALFGSMDLQENVMLPLEEFTRLPREARELVALMKLQLVGLRDSAHKLPSEISGGMQKRAAIARAMALEPSILFLDEPSAGLDPITSAGLDGLIMTLSRQLGITFIIVTHELQSILAIGDRAIMLDPKDKTIIAEGNPRHLKETSTDPRVRAFFNRTAPEGTSHG